MLFGKNRDSEIGHWLPNCTRCARTILLTTANFRTLFFPNSIMVLEPEDKLARHVSTMHFTEPMIALFTMELPLVKRVPIH